MNVALAHHWFAQYRGGEKVLEQIASLFPRSDIYTLIFNRRLNIPGINGHRIRASYLNRIPGALSCYRHLLPLHPSAIRRMQVPGNVDLLLSSDAALMKGITLAETTTHVCYCHSPPRYLWELGDDYKKASTAARFALDRFAPSLRRFDYQAAQRVDHFIANSHFVADRLRKYYGRESEVIYPPVAVNEFDPNQKREPFSLVISELVPYKRIDIAVQAFNRLGKKLVVIGDGPERQRLQDIAKPNIQFVGRQAFGQLKSHLQRASSFIFPGIEDFGITPVEAQAAGCPVIAFRAGGALETVIESRTGTFFDEQTPDCLAETVDRFDTGQIDPTICASHAESFSEQKFREKYSAFLTKALAPHVPNMKSRSHPSFAG